MAKTQRHLHAFPNHPCTIAAFRKHTDGKPIRTNFAELKIWDEKGEHLKKYSVRTYGEGLGSNALADSASELLDAICFGLEWGSKVVIEKTETMTIANPDSESGARYCRQ